MGTKGSQGGPIWPMIIYHTREKYFRAIWTFSEDHRVRMLILPVRTSQHWFQNNWRNHYRMNILLRNQENSFYRECKLQHSPISSNLFDEWDFCKHSHSQCCDAVQNHLESFKILTLGLLGTHRGPKRVHLSYLAEINMRSLWCSGRVQMALKHFSHV